MADRLVKIDGARGAPQASQGGDGRALGLCACLGIAWLLLALWPEAGLQLRYERAALPWPEAWRWLGAHLVHIDLRHALQNIGGLACLWLLFGDTMPWRLWWSSALLAIAAIDCGLWWALPDIVWYVGGSGLLHGWWVCGAVLGCLARDRLAGAALLVLAAKLAWEVLQAPSPLAGGVPVLVEAHRLGVAGGLLAALTAPGVSRYTSRFARLGRPQG
jgi:rhomboid family GlyGly-CTERM serine protease